MNEKVLRVTCSTKLTIPYTELHGIQGNLKMLTKENFAKLCHSITTDGFNFAIHVWKEVKLVPARVMGEKPKETVTWWVIDGHGRLLVVKHLAEIEHYSIPELPCVEIEAVNLRDAKRKVLSASSQFHKTTRDGLYEFLHDLDINVTELVANYDLPEINMDSFNAEYYADPVLHDDGKPKESLSKEFQKSELERYLNSFAGESRLLLVWNKEDHATVIAYMDRLKEIHNVTDYAAALLATAKDHV